MAAARKAIVLVRGLADDGAAGIENPRHDRGVDLRNVAFENRRTIHHRNARHADAILYGNTFAGERSAGGAGYIGNPGKTAERIILRRGHEAGQTRKTRLRQRVGQPVEGGVSVQRAAHHVAERRDVARVEPKAKIGGDLGKLYRRRTNDGHFWENPLLLGLTRFDDITRQEPCRQRNRIRRVGPFFGPAIWCVL